ncbi:MAG: periplasmic heavy metal sensor [Deltaproteobacteria bacterium]|nr:periplasmic heavy metal sensor [Deltaproteobacteria bacterium]
MAASKRRSPSRPQGYLDFIELSEEQRRQVAEIRRVFLPRVAALRTQLRALRSELVEQLFAAPTKRARAKATVVRISRLQQELELEVLDHILQEKELLTSSQQRQFREVIAQQFQDGGLGIHDARAAR